MTNLFRPNAVLSNVPLIGSGGRGSYGHKPLAADDYFSDDGNDDSDGEFEDHRPMNGEPVLTIPKALTTVPQEISFTVPDRSERKNGQDFVFVKGPHGPLRVNVPEGKKPGETASIRLGPPCTEVTVPKGVRVGDVVSFKGVNGQELKVTVPSGKRPGDTFEVSPPVLLVQVPDNAKPGTQVCYAAPDGRDRYAVVPQNCEPGQFFPVLIAPPGREDVQEANVTWPLELFFHAPRTEAGSREIVLQGPHGPLKVPLPRGKKPGEKCTYRIAPEDAPTYEVVVPEGAKPGDCVNVEGLGDQPLSTVIPEGKQAGDKFLVNLPTLMVRVPGGSQPGDEIMFLVPNEESVRFTRVPDGFRPLDYFPVLLHDCSRKEPPKPEEDKTPNVNLIDP